MRHLPLILLLLVTTASAQLTTTVKRIKVEYATAPELAATVLEMGHAVLNFGNPHDLRIGDGLTPGGNRIYYADWYTNNQLIAWGGLARTDIEALVALSIPHVDLTPYAFASSLLDYARLSDHAAATNALWGVLATKAAASNLVAEAARLDGRVDALASTAETLARRTDVEALLALSIGSLQEQDAAALLALAEHVATATGEVARLDVRVDGVTSTATGEVARLDGRVDGLTSTATGEVARLDGRVDGITASSLGALTVEVDPIASSNLVAEASRLDGRITNITASSLGALTIEEDPIASSNLVAEASRLDGRINGITADSLGALTVEEDPTWALAEPGVARSRDVEALLALSIGYRVEQDAAALLALAAHVATATGEVARLDGRIDGITAGSLGALTVEEDPIASSNLLVLAETVGQKVDAAWVAAFVLTNAAELGDYALATNTVTPGDFLFSVSALEGLIDSTSNAIPSLAGLATWLAGDNAFTGQAGAGGTPTVAFGSGGSISGFASISGGAVAAESLRVDGHDALLDNPSVPINNATAELVTPLGVQMGAEATFTVGFSTPPASFATGAGVSRLDLVTTNSEFFSTISIVATATNLDGEVVTLSAMPHNYSCTNSLYFDVPVRLPIRLTTAAPPPIPDTAAAPWLVDLVAWSGVPGRTYDLSGHTVLIPDGELPRQPVNRAQFDAATSLLSNRITAITPAENGVKLSGNAIEFGNRWSIAEEETTNDVDLVIRCQGDEVLRFAGGILAQPNMRQLYADADGKLTMIVLGNSNLTYGVEYTTDLLSTNEWEEWTNGVSADYIGSGLMGVTITNDLGAAFFRVKAESDGGAGAIQIIPSVPILGTTVGSGSVDLTTVWDAFDSLSNEVAAITNLTLDPTNFTVNLEGYVTTTELAAAEAGLGGRITILSNAVPAMAATSYSTWSTSILSRLDTLEGAIATNGNVTNGVVVPHPEMPGAVRVLFLPSHSFLDQARWSIDYGVNMLSRGGVVTNLAQGAYPLIITNSDWRFKNPTADTVAVYGGLTNTVSLTFAPQGKVSYAGRGSVTWGGGTYGAATGQTITSAVGPQTFIYSDETAWITPAPHTDSVLFGSTLAVPTNRVSWAGITFTFTNSTFQDWPGAPYDRSPTVRRSSDGQVVTARWGTASHLFSDGNNAYWPNVSVGGQPLTTCYLPGDVYDIEFLPAGAEYPPDPLHISLTNGSIVPVTATWRAGANLRVTSNIPNVSFMMDGASYSLAGYSRTIGPLKPYGSATVIPQDAGAAYITPSSISVSFGFSGTTSQVELVYQSVEATAKAQVAIEPAAAAAIVTNFTCRNRLYPAGTPVSLGVGEHTVSVANQYLAAPTYWYWYGAASSIVCTAGSTISATLAMTKAAKIQFGNTSGYAADYAIDGGAWGTDARYIRPGEYEVSYRTSQSDYFYTPDPTNIVVTNGQSLIVGPTWQKRPSALTVTLDPAAAANGAAWSIDAGTSWNVSGTTVSNLTWGEGVTVSFGDCINTNIYITPADKSVAIMDWNVAANFAYAQMGWLNITHTAPTMLPEMVRCTRDGGTTWITNGATLHLPTGSYSFIPGYESARNYASPGSKTVAVLGGQTETLDFSWRGYGWLELTCVNPAGKWDGSIYGTKRYLPEGSHSVNFHPVEAGWFPPATNGFAVAPWATNSYAVTYQQGGSISVAANPWPNGSIKVQGEWVSTHAVPYTLVSATTTNSCSMDLLYKPWSGWERSYRVVPAGNYTVKWPLVPGWAKPDDTSVTVEAGEYETINGQYTQ